MTEQPTPEQLAHDMRTFDSTAPDADARMRKLIADAEAGGDAHMRAVVEALPGPENLIPPGPQPDDLIFEPGRRPRYRSDDLNVTLRLDVVIDGHQYSARETLDPMIWEHRFSKDSSSFESFVKFFIHRSFGAVAHGSVEYDRFRSKLFIVTPLDAHDRPVCRRTNEEGGPGWPRCVDGAVLTEAPREEPSPPPLHGSPIFSMFGPMIRPHTVKGACGCRCHPDHVRENVIYGMRTSVCDL